jgi:hypothetical protein
LEQVALLPPVGGRITFGDTDHDGFNEVILASWNEESLCCYYHIFEEQGGNTCSLEFVSPMQFYPALTCDLDQDGRAEVAGQIGTMVRLYESIDATSYPTQLVWSSPSLSSSIGHMATGDTDRDGRLELIYNVPGSGTLAVFENTGDNTFDEFYIPTGPGGGAELVIADLDGDGLIEIAFAKSLAGIVLIYESPADNVWVEVFRNPTTLWNADGAEGGRDTDGNGKQELFVTGNTTVGSLTYWTTIVYESTGDNQFAAVDTFVAADGASGVAINALGNLDAVGREEFLVEGGQLLWIYRPTAPGEWELVDDMTQSGVQAGLYLFDLNRNGRPELFWTTSALGWDTLVLEHPYDISDVNASSPSIGALSIFPNPCRLEATLVAPGAIASDAARLAIYDVAGRLVERRVVGASGRRAIWPATHVAPGVYFLRLEMSSGEVLATGRGTVVR